MPERLIASQPKTTPSRVPARVPVRIASSGEKPQTYRKSDDSDPYVGVGRNELCPCGSGKKFKNCHGRNR